jgi:Skp family chaperone for outer membrane proteins
MHTRNLTILLVALLIGTVAYQGHALQSADARPTVARTVNLTRLFDALDERAVRDQELGTLAAQFETRRKQSADALDQLQEDLEAFPKGSDNYQATLQQLQKAALDYEAEVEWAHRRLDAKRAEIYRRIYLSIKAAARTLATERGYDLVFVDDSKEELPDGNEQDIRRQISARRMLYTADSIDVTAELIDLMNRVFRQS